MTTTYTLNLINNFSDEQFYFFTAPPIVGGVTQVFCNAFGTTQVPKGGTAKLQALLNFYAYCAPPQQGTVGTGTIITGGQAVGPATLATYQSSVIGTVTKTLELAAAGANAAPGCFSIMNPTGFTASNNFVIGLAMPSASGPMPVATFIAMPGSTNNIAPVINFYVAWGNAAQGTIIDYQQVSTASGQYLFAPGTAGEGLYTATITIDLEGNWSDPVYQ